MSDSITNGTQDADTAKAVHVARSVSSRIRACNLEQVVEATGLSESTIYGLIAAKRFPRPFKLGRRNCWRESTIEKFLQDEERKAQRKAGGE